jgi:hypothetical protein
MRKYGSEIASPYPDFVPRNKDFSEVSQGIRDFFFRKQFLSRNIPEQIGIKK